LIDRDVNGVTLNPKINKVRFLGGIYYDDYSLFYSVLSFADVSNVHASGMDPGMVLVLLITYGLPYVYGGVISVVCLVIGLVLKFKGRSGRVLFVFFSLTHGHVNHMEFLLRRIV
jgi:hypothetical protein